VYLGHHWPSDVIASYGLGLAVLSVLIAAEAWYRERLISRAEST
jgi:membrane-associated phospholipid phosphatase